jgi:conjugative relaxase-like TrwC/TraI family protein
MGPVWFQVMLVVSSATVSGVRYWERSAVHMTWLGRGAELLGLGAPGVQADVLRNLLAGKGPSGQALTARPKLRRRQGWDLVFGAPKSVSLLASAGDAPPSLRLSYRDAVADAFSLLQENAAWVSSHGRLAEALAVVAGAFEHLHNNGGQPHLHTHVVLVNIGALEGGRWGCLAGREIWRWREGLGAAFQLALRGRLAQAGLAFDWELGSGGLGEIAVLAPARAASSSRSLAVRAGAMWFGTSSARSARVAQGQSRGRVVTGAANKAPGNFSGVIQEAMRKARSALPAPPPSDYAVAKALAERSSSFAEPDVLVALAEVSAAGLAGRGAATWAKRFCEANQPWSEATSRRRWTTGLAAHYDAEVRALASEGRTSHLAEVPLRIARQELEALGTGPATAAAALQLACGGAAVEALPRGPWLAQAACLDAARAIWQAAGMAVMVAAPSEASQARWRALTSFEPADRGRPRRRVLLIDAADHLGPASLARLVAQAGATGTKLVLVPGGTVAGKGESMAASLDQIVAASGLELPGEEPSTTLCATEVTVPGLGVRGVFTGQAAVARVASAWADLSSRGEKALMVGLGPPEVEALNLAARRALGLAGAGVSFGGRLYAPGEQVIALRKIGPVRAGTSGTVVAASERALDVRWHGGPTSTIAPGQGACLGYGYATTVPYLRRRAPGELVLLLGDPFQLPGRDVWASWVTVSGPRMPAVGPAGEKARWRAGVAEIATGWPDEQMLSLAGPRPLTPSARRQWEQTVTSCALDRVFGIQNVPWPAFAQVRERQLEMPPRGHGQLQGRALAPGL